MRVPHPKPTPAVASRLLESIFSRFLGLASQANTCHRFAVKEESRKTKSKGQKLAQVEIDHTPNFLTAQADAKLTNDTERFREDS